jgi:hypothetical protein
MTIYLGIDDTDMPETPGTGKIARMIASHLSPHCRVSGITRHQLFLHPDIPYTSHNSSAVIHCEGGDLEKLFSIAKKILTDQHAVGSDPGLAIAQRSSVGPAVITFGMDAKNTVLTQSRARKVAEHAGLLLYGVGGTEDGVIGALAGIGLARTGNDGRFIQKNCLRDLQGEQTVEALLHGGIDGILTTEGRTVTEGSIQFRKFPKPALVSGKAVLFVEPCNGYYTEVIRG